MCGTLFFNVNNIQSMIHEYHKNTIYAYNEYSKGFNMICFSSHNLGTRMELHSDCGERHHGDDRV